MMKWLFNWLDRVKEETLWKIMFWLHVVWIVDVVILAIGILSGWRP